jgi:hypothetical protein
MNDHKITPADVKAARNSFEANEPRDLFYRAATELVDLALRGATSLTVAEALAVLLQTWNRVYYQYHKFAHAHFASIEKLLATHQGALAAYRNRTIDNLNDMERTTVSTLFQAFEYVLGPVGAAKALHLLAPSFFPLWDRSIANAYGLALGEAGSHGDRYWRFMLIAKQQYLELSHQEPGCKNPLKSIDEYNYSLLSGETGYVYAAKGMS